MGSRGELMLATQTHIKAYFNLKLFQVYVNLLGGEFVTLLEVELMFATETYQSFNLRTFPSLCQFAMACCDIFARRVSNMKLC